MDEIFDIIKKTKINRKYLVGTLIASEVLGIFVFIWLLRNPLYQKFLQHPPEAYSIAQMEPQIRYLVSQGDYLNGLTKSSGKIAVLLRSGEQIQEVGKIRAEEGGDWYYRIPDNLEPGIKTLTTAELDESNNILSLKSYKIRVIPNERINLSKNNQAAQTNEVILPPEEIAPLIDVEEKATEIPDIESSNTPPPIEE